MIKQLEDIYKVDIDRAFSDSLEKQEEIIEIIESRVEYYKNKKELDNDDDSVIESMIYFVADYLPRDNKFSERINTMIDDLWSCRDRFLNDNLSFCPKKGY